MQVLSDATTNILYKDDFAESPGLLDEPALIIKEVSQAAELPLTQSPIKTKQSKLWPGSKVSTTTGSKLNQNLRIEEIWSSMFLALGSTSN